MLSPVLGEDDVVRHVDAGVQPFAGVHEADDVPEAVRGVDGLVLLQQVGGGQRGVQEEVLRRDREEVQRDGG